jgi:hypothetical protein
MTFARDIERAAGEPIEAIVIGAFGWGNIDDEPGEAYGEGDSRGVPREKRGVVLSWDEARPLLDYEYTRGYGAPDCHAIMAWSASWVLVVGTYDGSTWLSSTPRNPVADEPKMVGGG